MQEEKISLREFARRMGVGEKTIRDGVKLGKISKGVVLENGKPKIIFSIAQKEALASGLGKKVIEKKESVSSDSESEANSTDELPSLSGKIVSLQEAIKLKENYTAKIKELEFKEKEGSLVNKQDVYSQLFEFHKEIKKSLLTIPDRITDTLLSFGNDRNKVYQLIFESIAGELDKLNELR